jgi:sec-independent protein translocase protein TatC
MFHHVKEIQMRLLITVAVLLAGMAVGYFFYEPLFQFIKAPLNGPLHYTSPSGSFNLILEICLMVGAIAAIPVGVYNVIMFVQPALKQRLSRVRVYTTTILSLVFAIAGAAFAFLVIIPLALHFFYNIQLNGLVPLISVSDYLRFVVNIIITFVIMFQLPLLMSLADHIKPIPPKKLLKAEKYIILASIIIAIVVPFAVDPSVQLLVASPIIVLYNISIVVILFQHAMKKRHSAPIQEESTIMKGVDELVAMVHPEAPEVAMPQQPIVSQQPPSVAPASPVADASIRRRRPVMDITPVSQKIAGQRPSHLTVRPPARNSRLIADMRPARPRLVETPRHSYDSSSFIAE